MKYELKYAIITLVKIIDVSDKSIYLNIKKFFQKVILKEKTTSLLNNEVIEIKKSYIIIQKNFFTKIVKSLIWSVVSFAFIFFAECIYRINFEEIMYNFLLVISCAAAVFCAINFIQCFIEFNNRKRVVISMIFSIFIGIRFFCNEYFLMHDKFIVEEWGIKGNIMLICTVYFVFAVVVFLLTMFFNAMYNKLNNCILNK